MIQYLVGRGLTGQIQLLILWALIHGVTATVMPRIQYILN
jgi:hypothetical protein